MVLGAVLFGLGYSPVFAGQAAQSVEAAPLARILGRAKSYCARLGTAALDYICVEEIAERSLETIQTVEGLGGMMNRTVERDVWVKHSFIYDYQFIRKEDRLIERRLLLEEDGKKREGEETRLQTKTFDYQNVMFGPVNLLDGDRQFLFDYELEGTEMVFGENAFILVATPKPSVETRLPWGRVWISEKYFTVLKIEWSQEAMSRTEIIQKRARRIKGTPQIIQITEFAFEKNGLRFPSKYTIGEAYITPKGKKIVVSELKVVYKDYKFFTVETDIKY